MRRALKYLAQNKEPLLLGVLIIVIAVAVLVWQSPAAGRNSNMRAQKTNQKGSLELISQVFRDGGNIPPQYTCKGQGVNPPLNISGVPDSAKSLALIMHDPDAPGG